MKTIQLYHFTGEIYLPVIVNQGIKVPPPVEGISPIQPQPESLGVWLTDDGDPKRQQWKDGSLIDKSAVRLTIGIPDEFKANLHRWRDLANEVGVSRTEYRVMDALGGYNARNWRVYREDIAPNWIVRVEVYGRQVDLPLEINQLWENRRAAIWELIRKLGRLPIDLQLESDEILEFSAWAAAGSVRGVAHRAD